MNSYIENLFKELEHLKAFKNELVESENDLYSKLSAAKKTIEYEHSHLIGKKAIGFKDVMKGSYNCVCVGVLCNSDYSTVKPLFNCNNKKILIDSYDWI